MPRAEPVTVGQAAGITAGSQVCTLNRWVLAVKGLTAQVAQKFLVPCAGPVAVGLGEPQVERDASPPEVSWLK